jgi:hypothetical protein
LSGFFRTSPLIIRSIPDIPLIPFAAHYVQVAKVYLPLAQVTNDERRTSNENGVERLPHEAKIRDLFGWDQEVEDGL